MNGTAAIIWLVLAVGLFVVETATYQMVCIWFSIGAVIAMIASLLGAPVWLQLLFFLLSSILVLLLGRPLVMEKLRVRKSATNADRVIGQVGIVIQEIDNDKQTGRVKANGLDWTARSVDGQVIPADSKVVVIHIEGVKLLVQPAEVMAPMH